MLQTKRTLYVGILTEEYTKKHNGLLAHYEKANKRMKELSDEKERKQSRERDLWLFIASIKIKPLVPKEWDERLWIAFIDRATVYRDGRILFRFKCGSEIEVEYQVNRTPSRGQ